MKLVPPGEARLLGEVIDRELTAELGNYAPITFLPNGGDKGIYLAEHLLGTVELVGATVDL